MKTSYEDFRLMKLRPAINNGKKIELSVQIDSYLSRTTYYEAVALGLKPGDTVSVRGKVCFDGSSTREYITMYMDDKILTEFINKFGSDKIVAEVNIKADFVYAIVNKPSEDGFAETNEELIACKLKEFS